MAGHQNKQSEKKNSPKREKKTHGKERKKWPKIPREEKPRERVLPKPIPNPKQRPSIRAPTRSPSGEKGPEGSWLRVLKVSDLKASSTFDLIDSVVSISEHLNCLIV